MCIMDVLADDFDCYYPEIKQENMNPIRLWMIILPVTAVATLVVTLTVCFFTVASVIILRNKYCKYNAYNCQVSFAIIL